MDASNLHNCPQDYHKDSHKPDKLFSLLPTTILYQDQNTKGVLHRLDCSSSVPVHQGEISLTKSETLQDVCYTDGILVCVHNSCPGIYAQNLSGKLLWSIENIIDGRHRYNMKCTFVTSDDNGHIFVCDINHHCVRVFSTDGEFISCLVTEGQHVLSRLIRIRWCKKTSSLILGHRKENSSTGFWPVQFVLKSNHS